MAFPKTITQSIRSGLSRYLGTSEERRESWDSKKNVWQTDKDTRHSDSAEVGSWKGGQARDADWTWDLLTDPYVLP